MKSLFIHDHIFKYDSESQLLFSDGKLSNESFSRYFEHFDTITIISRSQSIDASLASTDKLNFIDDSRISFIPFENQSTFKNRFLKRRKFKNEIREIIKDYDSIIIRVPSEIGFLVAEVCQEESMPYICEVVACPVDAMKGLNNIKSNIYIPIIKKSMTNCIARAYGALYVTESFLQNRYPTESITVSASNVELDFISASNKELRNKDVYTIGMIGNLDSDHKGYPVLYKALSELDSRINYKIIVLLIGGGAKYKRECNFDNIDVVFTGTLKKDKIHELLENSIDVYLQPSNQEGLPRATIEAMSHALPCIVSNAGGLPELIDSRYIHDVTDFTSIANMVDSLLTSPNEYYLQSVSNLNKSNKYLSSVLKPIRFSFYRNYRNYISKVN